MKAVILAGGRGTRLRPVTFSIPKPLVPLEDKTLIEVLITHLKEYDFSDLIISTGYMSDLVRAYCKDGSQWGVDIKYCHEENPLGTAGPLHLLEKHLANESCFLLVNGDIVTDLNLKELVAFHQYGNYALTVAYVQHKIQSPYGVLTIEEDKIIDVKEKPTRLENASGGIYILDKGCLSYVPDNEYFTIPNLIDTLRNNGKTIGAYRITSFWKGFESIENYPEVLDFLVRKKIITHHHEERKSHEIYG